MAQNVRDDRQRANAMADTAVARQSRENSQTTRIARKIAPSTSISIDASYEVWM